MTDEARALDEIQARHLRLMQAQRDAAATRRKLALQDATVYAARQDYEKALRDLPWFSASVTDDAPIRTAFSMQHLNETTEQIAQFAASAERLGVTLKPDRLSSAEPAVDSLHCPHCSAPLTFQSYVSTNGQMYCNEVCAAARAAVTA